MHAGSLTRAVKVWPLRELSRDSQSCDARACRMDLAHHFRAIFFRVGEGRREDTYTDSAPPGRLCGGACATGRGRGE